MLKQFHGKSTLRVSTHLKRFLRNPGRKSKMRHKLMVERKRTLTEHDDHMATIEEEAEWLKYVAPIEEDEAQKFREQYKPHVPNQTWPASDKIEQTPEQQLIWDEQNDKYGHKDRKTITNPTRKEIAEKHRKYPGIYNAKYLAQAYNISADEVHTILFEYDMTNKYKMFTADEVAQFRGQKDTGEDLETEKQAFLMNAYSDIISEKASKWMPQGPRTDIEYQESHKAPHEYYTEKILRNTRKPFLTPEEAHTTPKEGPGSGLKIPVESWQVSQPVSYPYLITDIQPRKKANWRPREVKCRERDGNLRWCNLDELNWVKFKEMHPMTKPQKNRKNITTKTRLLFKGILEPLSYHYNRPHPLVAHTKTNRWHEWWGTY